MSEPDILAGLSGCLVVQVDVVGQFFILLRYLGRVASALTLLNFQSGYFQKQLQHFILDLAILQRLSCDATCRLDLSIE